VVVAFSAASLAVTTIVALVTYGLASRYLLSARLDVATRQAYADARVARDTLAIPEAAVSSALAAVEIPAGTQVLIHRAGHWYGSGVAVGESSVPRSLRELVGSGSPGRQRVDELGQLRVAVGVPLRSVDAEYYEVSSLHELTGTLSTLRVSLIAAAVVTAILAAALALWMSRRVLRPLDDIGIAAGRIVEGERDVRLDPHDDPDLEGLADSFNAMVDALQQRIDRDARFVADVSHELRSPLTTLGAAVEVLTARGERFDERGQRAIALLADEVTRFQHAVEDLLELGRGDAGHAGTDLQPVQLAPLVEQAVRRHGGEPQPSVTIDDEVRETTLLLEARRVGRILANLLDNATVHGGGAVAVCVRRCGDMVRLEVTDRGPGVPEAHRTQVFERFFRGAAAGERGTGGGTGLGLALVSEHARAHGGTAWVEANDNGRGARFCVEMRWRPA
jgi:two-component system sensor histidine kinase MtrB